MFQELTISSKNCGQASGLGQEARFGPSRLCIPGPN